MKELWTGRVELLTPTSEFGDTKGFNNVFVWANSPEDFTAAISQHLEIESSQTMKVSPKKYNPSSNGYGTTRAISRPRIGIIILRSPRNDCEKYKPVL
jgi:hypothetical protein